MYRDGNYPKGNPHGRREGTVEDAGEGAEVGLHHSYESHVVHAAGLPSRLSEGHGLHNSGRIAPPAHSQALYENQPATSKDDRDTPHGEFGNAGHPSVATGEKEY